MSQTLDYCKNWQASVLDSIDSAASWAMHSDA